MTASQKGDTSVLPTAITRHDTIYWVMRVVLALLNGFLIWAGLTLEGFDMWFTPAAIWASTLSIFVLIASVVYAPVRASWLDETVRRSPFAQYGYTDPHGLEIAPTALGTVPWDASQITRWKDIRPTLIFFSLIQAFVSLVLVVGYVSIFV